MPAKIVGVDLRSPAEKAGVIAGDLLVSIEGHVIKDVFDLQFYAYEADLEIVVERDGQQLALHAKKDEGQGLGLDFETYLIDKPRYCANKCVFCFIDQMPPGMRETLYFKDDDARLSFLQGNYITLTNLTEADIARIISMRISPINISVHTTNPELRVKMLGNPRAGKSLAHLKTLADAGLVLNGQIVLCPGYNDGDELRRTLNDLASFYPSMGSVSVVPVGITRYRDNLPVLRPVEKEDAISIIDIVDQLGDRCAEKHGTRIFYCSDELYLTAEKPFPPIDYYEDFPQIENGVGMAALFEQEFMEKLGEVSESAFAEPFAIATGRLFFPILCKLIDLLKQKCHNIYGNVYAVENTFFGEKITVAGLVTGGDLIRSLKEKDLPGRLFIPSSMLRSGEDVFLDDTKLSDVRRELGTEVFPVGNDGRALLEQILMR